MYVLLQDQAVDSIPVCRLCGIQSLDLSYLDTFGEAGRYMVFAIQKYLDIEMVEKEVFPRNVCQNCSRKIEEWNDFYNKCQEIQTLLKSTPLLLNGTAATTNQVEESSVSNHLSKLVEEFVQDTTISNDKDRTETSLPVQTLAAEVVCPKAFDQADQKPIAEDEDEEDTNFTEDEFEDEISSGEELGDGELLKNSDEVKNRLRHKKFTFTIPFLERKVNRTFSPSEKVKLQKYISKRQNTMIYEMLVGGGPNQQWECQICQKPIKGRVSEVKKHYVKVHQAQPIYPCHACDYSSRTEKMYQAHRMSHLVEYPCQHCSKVFTQHSRLVYHMNSHTNQRKFECELCNKKFNTAQYVTTHKRKVHGDQEKLLKYTCELCGMRFKYKNHLQYHQKRHPTDENPLPYSCKYCSQRFMSRAEQLAHSNTIHAGEGDYVCHLCGKKMKTILSLENHVKLHSGLKEFKCQCGSAFATNHSLKCHQKIHLRQDTFHCPICKKAMSNKSSLNQHLKTHMGTKPYQCQHCSASFIHKNRLDIHLRKHTGEFPHSCPDCGKGFRSTSSMNSHRQYVHSERKFACQVCNKAFKTARDLKVHATLHTGEKPNVCGICGKAFRVRANYFKHRKIHMRVTNPIAASDVSANDQPVVETITGVDLETMHHNLVIPPVAATNNDFFQFSNEQQWIT